jgi:hypothetical protein
MTFMYRVVQFVAPNRLEIGPVPTNLRLLTSRHVGDLRFLFFGVFVLIGGYLIGVCGNTPPTKDSLRWSLLLALCAAAAPICSWIYQAANRRIGAVDLFASEIDAICRVCLVTDFAKSSLARHEALGKEATVTPHPLESKEQYTPVYDNGASDLQSLDSQVVSSVTTFYTYRKTMMDYLRAAHAETSGTAAQRLYEQMIYMQFLMYESGRAAIQELTEFEPDQAERLVIILCSELPLLCFLIELYRPQRTDFRYQRLCLRLKSYREDVDALLRRIDEVRSLNDPDKLKIWRKAITTSEELSRRYADFLPRTSSDFSS